MLIDLFNKTFLNFATARNPTLEHLPYDESNEFLSILFIQLVVCICVSVRLLRVCVFAYSNEMFKFMRQSEMSFNECTPVLRSAFHLHSTVRGCVHKPIMNKQMMITVLYFDKKNSLYPLILISNLINSNQV